MESRDTRFWLRIETGDRQGDRVPLSEGVHSMGRRGDNPIVIEDGSVSGKHAELRIQGKTVELVDLGSTNGTRVGARKIDSVRLAHGDRFSLGSIKLVLEDATLSAREEKVEALGEITADQLARSKAGSKRGWILGVLLVAALGVLAWRFLGGEQAKVERTVVASVPGNLLEDHSFEGDSATWISADAAPQGFIRDASFRKSGQVGLGAALAAGEWAFARSPEFELRPRRFVELSAWLAAEEGAVARVGIELASDDEQLHTFIAWAPAVKNPEGETVVLGFDTLPGYERGSVVVAAEATADGAVSLDDVSVVLSNDVRGAEATFNEYEARVLGAPGSTLAIVRSGRVLFAGIDLGQWGAQGLAGWPFARWTARKTETGLALAPESTAGSVPADAICRIRVNIEPGGDDEPWLATTGPDGYRAHATEFERDGATSFLIGRGVDLMRMGFQSPTTIRGSARQAAITIGFGDLQELDLQLTFHDERAQATQLANDARNAESRQQYGAAIAAWSDLLDRYPFEAALVNEAETSRSRLIQQGLESVEAVRQQVERARFFALSDLYRQCRSSAQDVGQRYAGTEVEADAATLLAEIDAALAELTGQDSGTRERLQGVLDALDSSKSPQLYERVKQALEDAPEGGDS